MLGVCRARGTAATYRKFNVGIPHVIRNYRPVIEASTSKVSEKAFRVDLLRNTVILTCTLGSTPCRFVCMLAEGDVFLKSVSFFCQRIRCLQNNPQ